MWANLARSAGGGGGLFRRRDDADGGGCAPAHENPFTSHETSKAPLAVPTISPDNDGRHGKGALRKRRAGGSDDVIKAKQREPLANEGDELQFRGNDNCGSCSFEGKGRQNVSMTTREPQTFRLGLVSTENDGMAHSPSITLPEKSATAAALPVAMITPVANARPPTAATTQSVGSASSAHKVAAPIFQTPRKATPEAASASSNTTSRHSTGITPHLNALSTNILPPYSPLTPTTRQIMQNESPFKSSMQLLDEKLQSIMKMEGRLDSKIEGVRERMWEEDDSFDCERENVCSNEFGVGAIGEDSEQRATMEDYGSSCASGDSGYKSLQSPEEKDQTAGLPSGDDTLDSSLSSSNELRRVLWSDISRDASFHTADVAVREGGFASSGAPPTPDSSTKEAVDSTLAWSALTMILGSPAPSTAKKKKRRQPVNLWHDDDDSACDNLEDLVFQDDSDGIDLPSSPKRSLLEEVQQSNPAPVSAQCATQYKANAEKTRESALQSQLDQLMTARGQLWDIVSELRAQLAGMTRDRDACALARDSSVEKAKALESELRNALESVKETQVVVYNRVEEAKGLRKLLEKRNAACEELRSALTSTEVQIEELHSTSERRENEWTARLDSVERNHSEETQTHVEEMERVRAELESTRASLAEQLERAVASHEEEVDRVRREAESSLALALEDRVRQLSLSHSEELERQRSELKSSSSAEIERVRAEAREQRLEEIDRMRKEVDRSSALVLEERVRELSASHAAALEEQRAKLETTHQEELERLRNEIKMKRLDGKEDPVTSTESAADDSVVSNDKPPPDDNCGSVNDSEGGQQSEQLEDTFSSEDVSYYVGDAEEGFLASESIHGSDISETASESESGDFHAGASSFESCSTIDESAVEEETMEARPEMLSGLDLEESAQHLPEATSVSEAVEQLIEQTSHDESVSTERELSATREQCDALSAEVEALKKSLAEAETARELSETSLDDARLQLEVRSKQIRELEQELITKDDVSQGLEEAIQSRDHFQGLAAKLAITVVKLKMQCKKQESAQSALQTERITELERSLDDSKASHSIPEEKLQLMVAKLASALVKMKGREVNLSKDKSALAEQILDLKGALISAQRELETASKEKAELNCRMKELARDKDTLQNELIALGNKVGALEAELQSSHEVTRNLETSAFAKDEENQQLHANVMNKTGALLDLRQQNKQLLHDRTAIESDLRTSEAERDEARASLQLEWNAASTARAELKQTEKAALVLQAEKLSLSNRLEAVLQEKSYASAEIEGVHNHAAALEVEKESLAAKLQECQEKALALEDRVITLESTARRNEKHIRSIESQLASKSNEAEGLLKTVNSHEATLCALRSEMVSLREQKAGVERSLSGLHSELGHVMGVREGLAFQLDKATKELEFIRMERNSLASRVAEDIQTTPGSNVNRFDVVDDDLETTPSRELFVTPQKDIREILTATNISEEDVDRVCEKMSKAQTIIVQIEQERKLLKKEVKHLRADLRQAREELATTKNDNKKISRQVVALRDVVSKARTVIEKAEDEKKRLASDLDNAQHAMKRIKRDTSQSYTAIVSQSQEEIKKLRAELREKNESIELIMSASMGSSAEIRDDVGTARPNEISQFAVSSSAVFAANMRTPTNGVPQTPKVSSRERFKIEKGSMFGVLTSTKRSGRRGAKYR